MQVFIVFVPLPPKTKLNQNMSENSILINSVVVATKMTVFMSVAMLFAKTCLAITSWNDLGCGHFGLASFSTAIDPHHSPPVKITNKYQQHIPNKGMKSIKRGVPCQLVRFGLVHVHRICPATVFCFELFVGKTDARITGKFGIWYTNFSYLFNRNINHGHN